MTKTKFVSFLLCLVLLTPTVSFASVQVTPGSAGDGMSPGDKQDVLVRLNTLERAVVELQIENAQLRAQPTNSPSDSSLAIRVAVLESKFDGLQQLLMTVVQMLTSLLAKLS